MLYIPRNIPIKCVAPLAYICFLIKYKGSELTTQEILFRMNYENNEYNRRWLNTRISQLADTKAIHAEGVGLNRYKFKAVKYAPGTFYQCDFKDIERIMRISDQCNNADLAGYYAVLCSTINKATRVGHFKINSLVTLSGVNRATILKYNRILEEHKIIYIVHSRKKGVANYYGLYEDKKKVDGEAFLC